ncbi:Maltose transport system permease protein MalG [Clostridiales bacterium CHKCI001]|nr:Maltose transport system permease protein MalG [Clostridiales bacterium CHKCI001]
MKTKKFIVNSIVHIFLAILVVIWVLPIVWVILISFREEAGAYTTTFLPKSYTIDNYVRLFTETDIFNFPLWFGNTFLVACCSCVIATFYTLSVSYVMSRMRFKMRKPFMNIALILGMFPGFMSMIAVYYILKAVGLTEGALKLVALVLVYSGGAGLGFYVAKGFFDTIPKAIDEAACIDGCTRWQIFTKITIPLSKPIIVQTILSAFMSPWMDFIFAKVIAGSEARYYTVAIGLWNMLTRENITNFYTRFAAGAVLVSIPIAILFLSMQKYYMESNAGAVKG